MASHHSLSLLLTFASVLFQVCHVDGLQFTKHDYESGSSTALLNVISHFQIKKTDLFPELQTTENQLLDQNIDLKQCSCKGNTCECCMHVKMDKIGLKSNVCLRFSYLPRNFGVLIQLTMNGKVIFKKEISAKNPPPICAGVPGLKKMASVCIRFYDLSVSTKQFSGCVELQGRLYKVITEKVKLGCFKIPPTNDDVSFQNFLLVSDEADEIVQSGGPMNLKGLENILMENILMADEVSKPDCRVENDAFSCCLRISMFSSKQSVCLKIAFLQGKLGVDLQLTFAGKVILHKSISAKDPPPICVPIPKMKKAQVCIVFTNLELHTNSASGCVALKAKIGFVEKQFKLGCFKLPPQVQDHQLSEDKPNALDMP